MSLPRSLPLIASAYLFGLSFSSIPGGAAGAADLPSEAREILEHLRKGQVRDRETRKWSG